MDTTQRNVVVGVFEDRDKAREAIHELYRLGFSDDEIGVASRDDEVRGDLADTEERGSHAGGGALAGALTGAGAGGLWALGIAAGVLPAIGPVIARRSRLHCRQRGRGSCCGGAGLGPDRHGDSGG